MWKKLTLLATVAGAAVQIVRHYRATRASRRKHEARQAMQRWEDEGGSLTPAEAAAVTAKPRRRARTTRSAAAA
jgi:hypothetical protein